MFLVSRCKQVEKVNAWALKYITRPRPSVIEDIDRSVGEYMRKTKMIDEESGTVRQSHWYMCAPGYAN